MSDTRYYGIGFLEALTLLFVGLKLGNVITWSWLWVLAPLWIPFALIAGVILLLGIGYLASEMFR